MSTFPPPPPRGPNTPPSFGYTPARKSAKKAWIWAILGASALAIVVVIFLGWLLGSSFLKGKRQADAAVLHFHEQFNGAQYEAIVDEADHDFVSPDKHDYAVNFFSGLHSRLGDAGAASFQNININTSTGEGTIVTCIYNTMFASGPGVEEFKWKKVNGALKLYSYHVRSNALQEKPPPAAAGNV